MDEKAVKDKENSESSLSESWNIVDGNDVNNISEGSDGESIEVIEEEGANNSSGKETDDKKDKVEFEKDHSSKIEDENTISTSVLQNDQPPPEENFNIPRTVGADFTTIGNMFNILGLVSMICAIIFTGATAWVFLMKVEEFALDTFHYLIPGCQHGAGNIEYNDLVTQLKMYEEEAKNLRSVVTDLSGAVENLKKELAFSLKFADKSGPSTGSKKGESNQAPNEEDILFQELLNIHIGKFHNGSIFRNEMNFTHGHVGVFIQEMIFNYTSGKERESNMEAVKLFYQIPKHLTVLYNFNSTNKNIELFVNAWKSKLSFVNEKIVEDMRAMQLKMVRQFVKHMKYTQRRFYTKLCNLSGIKKQECYNRFVKPYEQLDEAYSTISEDEFDPNVELSGSEEPDVNNILKDGPVNVTNRSEEMPVSNESSEWKTGKKIVNKANSKTPVSVDKNGNENYYKENAKGPREEEFLDNRKKIKEADRKMFPKQERPVKDSDKRNGNPVREKGMENDLHPDAIPIIEEINSFSSFSKVQGDETGYKRETFENRKEGSEETREGKLSKGEENLDESSESDTTERCWFLKIGSQRSKIRKSESRSNWLFERARRHNRLNT